MEMEIVCKKHGRVRVWLLSLISCRFSCWLLSHLSFPLRRPICLAVVVARPGLGLADVVQMKRQGSTFMQEDELR